VRESREGKSSEGLGDWESFVVGTSREEAFRELYGAA